MIIGISGKKNHGKDTVAKIINFLCTGGLDTYESFEGFAQYYEDGINRYPWKKKMFAEKVKQIVCLLIGCTMEQLEDPHFKERPLGEEWDKWVVWNSVGYKKYFDSEVDAIERFHEFSIGNAYMEKVEMTPRLMMQLIGTECGRQIIHPNVWVNALMSEYKQVWNDPDPIEGNDYTVNSIEHMGFDMYRIQYGGGSEAEVFRHEIISPNWIITDVRFPNEVKAIKERGGIVVRVNRPMADTSSTHPSEILLDNYEGFDATFTNDEGNIDLLIDQIRIYLKHINII